MPRCKRCGCFGSSVCEVDESYSEEIRQELQDLAETREQIAGVIRRVRNTHQYQVKEEEEKVQQEEYEYATT